MVRIILIFRSGGTVHSLGMRYTTLLLMAVLAGCGSSEGSTEEPIGEVTFSDAQAVFDQHCTSCHFYGGQSPSLTGPGTRDRLLSATTTCWDPAIETIVDRPVVVPGDPAGSVLWHKLANIDLNCGREMPPMGTGGLIEDDHDDFLVVEKWIASGAGE